MLGKALFRRPLHERWFAGVYARGTACIFLVPQHKDKQAPDISAVVHSFQFMIANHGGDSFRTEQPNVFQTSRRKDIVDKIA
jgi:hypothetical protein